MVIIAIISGCNKVYPCWSLRMSGSEDLNRIRRQSEEVCRRAKEWEKEARWGLGTERMKISVPLWILFITGSKVTFGPFACCMFILYWSSFIRWDRRRSIRWVSTCCYKNLDAVAGRLKVAMLLENDRTSMPKRFDSTLALAFPASSLG